MQDDNDSGLIVDMGEAPDNAGTLENGCQPRHLSGWTSRVKSG